jgi:predicted O-linked N-acetylglucosamine transferase (SPINDLY family)
MSIHQTQSMTQALSRPAARGDQQWRRGVELARQGKHHAAIAQFKAATRSAPRDSLYWLNLASSQHKCNETDAALLSARQAFELDQCSTPACHLLAEVLRVRGRHAEAMAVIDALEAGAERDASWHLLKGSLLFELHRTHEAMQALLSALAQPGGDNALRVKALMQLGHCLAVLRRHHEAGQCYRTVLDLAPESIGSAMYAAHYSAWVCDWTELELDLERLGACIAKVRNTPAAQLSLDGLSPFCLLTLSDDPELLRWAAELACGCMARRETFDAAAAAHSPGASLKAASPKPSASAAARQMPAALLPTLLRPAGRLRLGLLSSDFHHHATTMLIVEALEHIDRSRYELYLYSGGKDDGSALRQRVVATATAMREIAGLDNEQVARQIRDDQIGVLFDLKGYTMGSKMGVLARRPAPIQVAWLGYPGTCGADFVDYIVGDRVVTPMDAQADFSEHIAQLPHCYQPNDSQRLCPPALSRSDCGLPEHAFVFASFNQAYKIVPEVFAAWCRITASRADAVLWLMVPEAETQARLRAAAAKHGLAPERLIFAPFLHIDQHRARLPNVDLALDTFPCGGHTTASDALWAGVPVLALQGQAFASRVAASLLLTLGAPELVCTDLDQYIERAVALAGSAQELTALRQRVQSGRSSSPLFDGRAFAHDLTDLIERMAARHAAGLAPAALAAHTTATATV